MIGAARLLAGWLTPVMWLAPAAMVVADGPEGLWIALVVALSPLVALLVGGARASDPPATEPPLHHAILVAVIGLLVWANLALAGDVAAALGIPRWHGIVLASSPALVALALARFAVAPVPLLVLAFAGIGLPLMALMQGSGVAPGHAWQMLAAQPAFRFAPHSAAVADGRDLGAGSRPIVVAFDEEQRVTAPAGGAIRVLTRDALREPRQEVTLAPGQAVALRPGDRVEADPGTRLRFEAGRRVPGAPASGAAWAAGPPPARPAARLSFGLAVVGGAVALFADPRFAPPRRATAVVAGAGLLAALGWSQAWAVYGVLQAPDVYLGGIALASMIQVPVLAVGGAGARLQTVLLAGLLAALAAASASLIERPHAAQASPRDGGRALGLWALLFAGAGAAALRAVDPWAIALWAFGLAASTVAVSAVLPVSDVRLSGAGSGFGVGVFAALSAVRWLEVTGPAAWLLALDPLLAAIAVSVVCRLAFRRVARA